jgi:hypothetical protein
MHLMPEDGHYWPKHVACVDGTNEICSSLRLYVYWALSQNCEKLLLASPCPSVCVCAWNKPAPTGRIVIKSHI